MNELTAVRPHREFEPFSAVVMIPRRVQLTEICAEHGAYTMTRTFLGSVVVCESECPQCAAIRKAREQAEADAKAAAESAEEQRRAMEHALGRTSIPDEYLDKEFENFIAATPNEVGALKLARRFVAGWQKAKAGGYGLFFYGNPGTGKSHLACAILKGLLPAVFGLYTRAQDIIQYIRSTWSNKSDTTSFEAIRKFTSVDLLVIDEIGIQAGTPNEQQILFSIIDDRISQGRPTIFLSNLAPNQLVQVLGVRLVDRIRGCCVPYRFDGASHRAQPSASVFGDFEEEVA